MFIDTADIARIYAGRRSDSWCRKLARTIRDAHSIGKGIPIPVEYFCEHAGLTVDHINRIMNA